MTQLIKTASFELAVYMKGNFNAHKLALVLPGRLDTKDYPHMRSHVDYLAGKGYLAVSFDPPGTWASPGNITIYTMTNYLIAINELIEYFGNKPTILIGHSRGGSMAMLAGTRNNTVTHIITAMSRPQPSKIYNQENGVEVNYRDTPSGDEIRIDLPLSYFEDASQYDMLDALAHCDKPKLYFYGIHDEDIRPEFVKDTYDKSAEPKQIRELDSDHDYRRHPNIIDEINTVIGDFLHRYS